MTATYQHLFSNAYLRAVFDQEFQKFKGSPTDEGLLERLDKWSSKSFQKETSAEGAFINVFFEETWGYTQSGKHKVVQGFTCYPKFPVAGAGQGGGTGEADAALGCFETDVPSVPQVLCEFKDVRSNLDAPQKRKGNNRSPVKQCADYLREAMKPLYGNEAIQPTWGIVTDMNEFRLYWRNTMPSQYQRFIIKKATTDEGVSLLEKTEEGSFQRFLFAKLLHSDNLLTTGGASRLLLLLKNQRFQEKEIENTFYREYRAYREYLIAQLIEFNPLFPGTKGRIVRLAQKLIDRCIFVMFCEDMGEQLSFPPNALRDYLAELSKYSTYEPEEGDAWNKLKELFQAMNEGKKFRARDINRFNGGLFAPDTELEQLAIPNSVFCTKLQGESDEMIASSRLTLLYFAASYNFGTVKRDGKAITLFTLGRIFEQSITELEALEAQADKKPSLTIINQRKRDGVYYTPEWIVERVVAETLGTRLDEIKRDLGWSFELEGDEEQLKAQVALAPSKRSVAYERHVEAVLKFRERLDSFTVLDPACGSGAFLIHTLEFLLRERRRVERELALVKGGQGTGLFDFKSDEAVRTILSKNIFGVDINPASVEIARLALWLHTAKSDQPLTNLDSNIVTGNSLVGNEIYEFKKDLLDASEIKRETINAFDFEDVFPAIFDPERPDGRGFDCIVGNPPYVQLQKFKKVYPDTAEYLKNAKAAGGVPLYRSCQTGSFDLYLPFIEHGIQLLNEHGRLGYIAPSVWRFNQYGLGLKRFLKANKALERWLDFGSFQVFEEATTYTALQFYSKTGSDAIQIALAPDGAVADAPDWDDKNWRISYEELSNQGPWVFASRTTLDLVKKVAKSCRVLGDKNVTSDISQGLVSGAFEIFANDKVGPGLYHSPMSETEILIEEEITKPLLSASDIDRFLIKPPHLSIIFPYDVSGEQPKLLEEKKIKGSYPHAWKHLKNFEERLRERDAGQFAVGGDEEDRWYAYSRNQNLEKQSQAKIVIAGTGNMIEAALDVDGSYATNDKRVYSVFPAEPSDLKFLTGILNSRTFSFFFRLYARPKANGYYDIETQFLAPLPVPKASAAEKKQLEVLVDELGALHQEHKQVLDDLKHRLTACDYEERNESWLWPNEVGSIDALKAKASKVLSKRAATAWAKEEQKGQIALQIALLDDRLLPTTQISISADKGELVVYADGVLVLDKLFLDQRVAELTSTYWRSVLQETDRVDAALLMSIFLKTCSTSNPALQKQILEFDAISVKLSDRIKTAEEKLNTMCDALYKLTPEEIRQTKGYT